jgi:CheY-like chemotaxis protein
MPVIEPVGRRAAGGHAMSRQHVLIVEDDPDTRQQFSQILSLEGYCVITASSLHEGIAALERLDHVDALLLDWHLPDIKGLAAVRQLRAVPGHRQTPLAIITGDYFLDESVPRDLQDLSARIRFKPMWAEELVALVGELTAANP